MIFAIDISRYLIYNPEYQQRLYFTRNGVIKINGIKCKRVEAGLSQKQLADIMGVTQAAIANWETGGVYPRASQLPALAEALNCTIDDLYNGGKETDG